jgi:hypothetical protein
MKAFFAVFMESGKGKSSGRGTTIVLRPGEEIGEQGKYRGTVMEWAFVVPFSHCFGRCKWAVWGCVGKVRAGHICVVVLSLRHPADTTW